MIFSSEKVFDAFFKPFSFRHFMKYMGNVVYVRRWNARKEKEEAGGEEKNARMLRKEKVSVRLFFFVSSIDSFLINKGP